MEENRQLLQRIFQEMSMGDSRPFVSALADDVTWKVMGRTQWSGTYRGKQTVLNELLRQLQSRLADRYRASADRIIAEGPYVVVQAHGQAMTTAGTPYNNEYCFIYRIENGQIKEVTEYLDTDLLKTAFSPL